MRNDDEYSTPAEGMEDDACRAYEANTPEEYDEKSDKTVLNEEAGSKRKQPSAFMTGLYECVNSVMLAILMVCVIYVCLFRMVYVDGYSMENTLFDKERLAIATAFYKLDYGDIVVITREEMNDTPIVKRLIAMEGDSVDIDFATGEVSVNGKILDEPYIKDPTTVKGDVSFPLTVPDGCIFVMGDNRSRSLDSRYSEIGFIRTERVMGEAVYKLSPFGAIE